MLKIEFTPEELKNYFKTPGGKEHYFADETRQREAEMRVHSDGLFPEKLINERRPNEPEDVRAYRNKIFVPKTKPSFAKIESTLQKIRRSSDWSIKYSDASFDRVIDGEKLFDYAETKFPVFGSITNWTFSLLLRNYLIDANALCLVAPLELPTNENVYIKPVCTIFNSEDVIYFAEDNFAIVRNKSGATYYSNGKQMEGQSFFVVTTIGVYRYDQVNGRGNYVIGFEYEHGFNELPIFKLGGIVTDVYGDQTLYESRISGILPEFNEALREYSDLQAAKVLHLYPERWEYSQNECNDCRGVGKIPGVVDGVSCMVECKSCSGGYRETGPFSKIIVKPVSADQLGVPTPPAGFIEKDVEIIKVQSAGVEEHIYKGLAAINFEFLAATPINQSGTAKEVDKDELNNTVYSIAEDLVRIMDNVYRLVSIYRYGSQYTIDEIEEMLPMIAVPEKFDILSNSYFAEQMKHVIDMKLSPAISNAMQVTYATKAFNNDLEIAEHVGLLLKLDPLAGITEDDKMSRLSNGGITKLDYIVSSNINKLVELAKEAYNKFMEFETKKQREIIYELAKKQDDEEITSLLPTDLNNE